MKLRIASCTVLFVLVLKAPVSSLAAGMAVLSTNVATLSVVSSALDAPTPPPDKRLRSRLP